MVYVGATPYGGLEVVAPVGVMWFSHVFLSDVTGCVSIEISSPVWHVGARETFAEIRGNKAQAVDLFVCQEVGLVLLFSVALLARQNQVFQVVGSPLGTRNDVIQSGVGVPVSEPPFEVVDGDEVSTAVEAGVAIPLGESSDAPLLDPVCLGAHGLQLVRYL